MELNKSTLPRVEQLASNQYIINDGKYSIFQSYNSRIVVIDLSTGQIYLDSKKWDYSVTTGKYRNKFLGEGIAETRKKINSGEYILADLN